ncbi:MAG: FAD-dependent oxidoreductase [Kiloniellales bacterium]
MAATYEWIVVGGGIAGIAIAEILTREGHSVLLLEQGEQLAGEASGDLHEWIHTGCLYTLVPDRLITMKYLLGAIDDLLEYYGCFPRVNALPTEQGLALGDQGWFEPNYIRFRYRNRRFNPLWTACTARSRFLIERIARHDWRRRRAGIVDEFKEGRRPAIWAMFREQLTDRQRFLEVESTDFTVNSRMLLQDLLAAALGNGLQVRTGQRVREIRDAFSEKLVVAEGASFRGKRVVLCAGKSIADLVKVKVTKSYAPMAVIGGLSPTARSFVELDLKVRNCINLLVKGGGLGLAGGISLKRLSDCDGYLDDVLRRLRAYEPSLVVLGRYPGVKSEITFPNQDRNYLFHIVPCGDDLWATIPGKFTLGFSLAPEFYRRIYHRNPRRVFDPSGDVRRAAGLIAEVRWRAVADEALRSGKADRPEDVTEAPEAASELAR